MTHVPHELHEEFPDASEVLHQLKLNDAHFARLSDRYHHVNRQIHRAETLVEPMADETLEELKKERLKLKDEIAGTIARAKAA
jgi:uncharacterized protein YdcH (DUF465 family)